MMKITQALVAFATLFTASIVQAQVGPDIINSSLIDVARYGTDLTGQVTAYAIGAMTCNHGDIPAMVAPTGSTIRPLVAQNMYRLKSDASGSFLRFEQVGQSWVKRVAAPVQGGGGAACGTCQAGPSGTMGVGCADAYSSGFNSIQGLLGPRSYINGTTAVSAGNPIPVGDSITRGRIQVPTQDVVNQPAGTRFFAETVHLLPDDAQYVRSHQTVAINALNNAASQEININGGTASPTLLGSGPVQLPAVTLWQSIDPAVMVLTVDDDETPNPSTAFPGTFIRSRFFVAVRTTALTGGHWRYEYAIFNLNSDRSAGSFSIPLPAAAPLSDLTFHAPQSHSGEPYSNAAWSVFRSGQTLTFLTDSYATNPNANAIRWGTMYNFGFTTTVPPSTGNGQLGLFKPGALSSLNVSGLAVPTVRTCSADFDNDGTIGADTDIEAFFACLAGNCCPTCESVDFNSDGDVGTDGDIESFFRVLAGGSC